MQPEIKKQFCIPGKADFDFNDNPNWRMFRIMAEFVRGFEYLGKIHRGVTFFGSARLPEDSKYYKEAIKLGELLGKEGFAIVTGGGPGIMEAGNRGAKNVSAMSVGLNIELPMEQRINPYVTNSIAFHYFFSRKVMLSASSQAYVYFPGGFGTLDECFEIITLVQTEKIDPLPIVLLGKDFWDPLVCFMKETMLEKFETISAKDFDLFTVVNTAEEAFAIVKKSKERKYF